MRHMARALRLARRGLYTTHPNPRVGCVLVCRGEVVGEGWHERAGEPHAEVHALRAAGKKARGATAYVTLEPCSHHGRTPPCADALIEAGVARVVIGAEDPNPLVAGKGLAKLRKAGIKVETGVMREGARALNRGFHSRHERGRPWVTVKLGSTLDGCIAAANGESRWITGAASRADVHRQRAAAGCVLTGIGTVLADDPQLNVRMKGNFRQPLRVVLDRRLRIPTTARLLNDGGETLVLTTTGTAAPQLNGGKIERLPTCTPSVVLRTLAELGVNEVLVEAGPALAGAFLEAGLVDELLLYVAPSLLGDTGRGLVTLPGVRKLQDRLHLKISGLRRVGEDIRITAVPIPRSVK